MKSTVKCKSCGQENATFRLNCTGCNNYLRARVWNINLWHNIRLLIESPTKAFQNIIWSEHKNFAALIIIISAIKFMVDSFFLKMSYGNTEFLLNGFFSGYLLILIEVATFSFLFALAFFYSNKIFQIETRIRDIFAIISYSFIPSIFALVFLFLVEIILFGRYLFSVNPLPTLIKPTLAYVLLGLEVLIFLWSIFLLSFGFYTLTKIKLYSILSSLVFFILLLIILLLTPFSIF